MKNYYFTTEGVSITTVLNNKCDRTLYLIEINEQGTHYLLFKTYLVLFYLD